MLKRKRSIMSRKSFAISGLVLACVVPLSAEQPLDGSSYWLHEGRRRLAIADQIGTQEHLRWLSGLPSRLWGVGRPYSLESIYSGLAYSPGAPAPWKTVFEPWPLVPGDIYGRQFDRATPQPWGHRVTPTGPNGYVYEPVYEPPLPALTSPALPPALSSPPRATAPLPPPEEVPLPASPQELREF
jgi:hypothetical protein